jgi:hypothetical protein
MKHPLVITVALLLLSEPAEAQVINARVPPGKTTTVFIYRPFDRSTCHPQFAVATLAVKPQHGRASHYLTPSTIPTQDRFRQGQPTGCAPKPTTGFAVTYTPAAGFHGFDTFTLDVSWKGTGEHAVDVFKIVVE